VSKEYRKRQPAQQKKKKKLAAPSREDRLLADDSRETKHLKSVHEIG
jgi:hypothetical protein